LLHPVTRINSSTAFAGRRGPRSVQLQGRPEAAGNCSEKTDPRGAQHREASERIGLPYQEAAEMGLYETDADYTGTLKSARKQRG
jgi:hypothetical protein